MADVYGPGLDGVFTYTRFARKQMDGANELTRQIQKLDANNPADLDKLNELTNRIQEMRIALDYASDVLSLMIKLTQPVQ
jgi:hypothetical protein